MKNTGKSTESYIQMILESYESSGRAFIRKVDPPTAVIRIAGKPVIIQKKNPFLDYVGVWTEAGGRAIFIEAKSSQIARLPINRDGGVTPDQYKALLQWHAAGAAVCVLWEYQRQLRLVSLERMKAVEAEGRASIKWSDAYSIPGGLGFTTHDFLTPLAAIYNCIPVKVGNT